MGDFEDWQRNKAAAAIRESARIDVLVESLLDDAQALLDDARTCKAYDDFAREALCGLFVNLQAIGTTEHKKIAAAAWSIADAMMVERKKRNLGHIETDDENDKEG
ncbi:MAG TPA: hypothetical protein VFI56_28705 [Vicinamibacterales bacterium]|nr:hypothetical protein [Vicinamibacterales bacterium]